MVNGRRLIEMTKPKDRKGTRTSAFGAPGHVGHDSTGFYAGRLYQDRRPAAPSEYVENEVAAEHLDRIFCHSSEAMDELPDGSVHLMVTSPPYNVSKEYDQDLTLDEYREMLRRVFVQVHRKLVTGGRACINLANLGRRPYIPLHSYVIADMLDLGFLMRGEIIWNKAASASPSTAWGSWLSAANPTLRDVHEYILVFCKDSFDRRSLLGKASSISRDEFLECTRSVWSFPAEPARKVGHPAPFPVELPYRLVQLYTYRGEVVLDPFMGSGATAIAALKAGRAYVGYEINPDYVALAERRIAGFHAGASASASAGGDAPPPEG